jgi:prepilin-type N-terminal cleavage/methylation domain-containing protein
MIRSPDMESPCIIGQRGFTLIELLIALFISIVIGVATIGFMTYSHKSHAVQEQVADAQQNARIAFDHVLRDIRMAGYPLGYFKTTGFTPIETAPIANVPTVGLLQQNNSSNGFQLAETDAIAIWRGDSDSLPISCYPSGGGGAAAATIRIRNNTCPLTTLRENDILMVIKPDGSAFRTIQITNLNPCQPCAGAAQQGCSNVGTCDVAVINPGLSNVNSPGGLGEDYTGGTAVKFRRLVYFVNPTGRLMRSENNQNPVALATNVEDLQLAYVDNTSTVYTSPDALPNFWNLRQVRLNLLTRTANPDPLMSSRRPGLEDRAGEAADVTPGFRRRLLQEEISLRNFF